jgi:hypothetical protein
MANLLNRARMTTATTGTGAVTLGSAVASYFSFAEAGAVNATAYSYVIEEGDDFEIGSGTYTSSGTTLSRDTVTASKIGGTAGTSKMNLAGNAQIFITGRAQDIITPTYAMFASGTALDFGAGDYKFIHASGQVSTDSSDRLQIGSATNTPGCDAAGTALTNGVFQIIGTNTTTSTEVFARFSNDAASPVFVLEKSRGTSPGSFTVVQSGDLLGQIIFAGSDDTDFAPAAAIRVNVDGTPGNNDMPGRIAFYTTADGAGNASESVRISNSGATSFPRITTTASAANAFLDSGSSPANNLLRSTSSVRYKRDIEPIDDERVDAFFEKANPIWFRSTSENDNPEHSFYSFSAEEIAEIDPRLAVFGYRAEDMEWDDKELCFYPKNGAEKVPDGIQTAPMVAMMFNKMRRMASEIAELKKSLEQAGS